MHFISFMSTTYDKVQTSPPLDIIPIIAFILKKYKYDIFISAYAVQLQEPGGGIGICVFLYFQFQLLSLSSWKSASLKYILLTTYMSANPCCLSFAGDFSPGSLSFNVFLLTVQVLICGQFHVDDPSDVLASCVIKPLISESLFLARSPICSRGPVYLQPCCITLFSQFIYSFTS